MGYEVKILTTYSLDLILSSKYLQVIIEYLEPKIFKEQVEVLFYKIKKSRIKYQLTRLIS